MVLVPEIAIWSLLAIAAITDLRFGKIPNWLTFTFFFSGILWCAIFGGLTSLGSALSASAMAFFLFFPLTLFGVMAAGDAKLLIAVGAWTSPGLVLKLAGLSILVGAVVGVVVLLATRGLRGAATSMSEHLTTTPGMARTGTRIPFGPAFLCAYALILIADGQNWRWL